MYIWKVATGKLVATLAAQRAIDTLAFSKDATYLVAVAQADQAVYMLWNTKTKKPMVWVAAMAKPPDEFADDLDVDETGGCWARSAQFSPRVDVLALGCAQGIVQLRDPATGKLQKTFRQSKKERPVRALAFSPSGKWLASGSSTGTIVVWPM